MAFNAAARFEPFLVLRDFDREKPCPPALVVEKLPKPERYMCFRLAVPEIEAWIMGDVSAFSAWLKVTAGEVPKEPEELVSAKAALLALAGRSKDRELRRDLLPDKRSGRREGKLYAARLIEFVSLQWNPRRAAKSGCVPSLTRALSHLDRVLKEQDNIR